jgi:uncharacterized sulfatase
VYVPPKWQHLAPPDYEPGGSSDRLVSFYDLAPTLLHICGVQPPPHMHGRPFMGPPSGVLPAPPYAFGFRGRMDERYDLVRCIRDQRYLYMRQFMPHKPYGQYVDYMFQTPTTRVWQHLFDAGELNDAQARFWQTKPSEELYDLESDPDEVHNLAGSPAHRAVLQRMRTALFQQLVAWRDVGFLPEEELHTRAQGAAPWTMAQDDARYPLEKIMAMADLASSLRADVLDKLLAGLADDDSAVRYWAALGLLMRGEQGVRAGQAGLRRALADPAPPVRVIAAEALACHGDASDLPMARDLLVAHADLRQHSNFTAMLALNALQAMGREKVLGVRDQVAALPRRVPQMPGRTEGYVAQLLAKLTADLRDQ